MKPTSNPLSATDLSWRCDVCRRPIDDEDGYVTLDLGALKRYEVANAAWEAETRAQHNGHLLISGRALDLMPEAPGWQVLHRACDPGPERCDYWISVERIRTAATVMEWTAHLLGKTWFGVTRWDDLLRGRVIPQLAAS